MKRQICCTPVWRESTEAPEQTHYQRLHAVLLCAADEARELVIEQLSDAMLVAGKAGKAGNVAEVRRLHDLKVAKNKCRRPPFIERRIAEIDGSIIRFTPAVQNHNERLRAIGGAKMIAISNDVRDLAADASRPFEERVEQATASITKLLEGTGRDDWQSSEEGAIELLDRMQEQADGTAPPNFTPTGLTDLDGTLDGGLRGGELVVLGARPGMGKTAMAMAVADHVAMVQGKPVAVFSMEMPRAQLHARRLAMRSRVPLSRIKRAERMMDADWPRITDAVEDIRKSQMFINDQGGLTINQVRAKARGIRRRAGSLGLIVVDYLGLMTGADPKQPRTYQLEDITKGLKALAKELHCPILLLCQISRTVEQRPDPMPMLSDLRDSGAIEQDADIVIFVHRDIVTKPDLSDEWKHYARVSVAKQRDGQNKLLNLMYQGECTLFQDWSRGMAIPIFPARLGVSKPARKL